MKRRSFLTLLGGAAAAWPLAAGAQQAAMPVVGYLHAGVPEGEITASDILAFRKGLSEMGYVDGRNVRIEFRFAYNDYDRQPELVADLIRHRVAGIVSQSMTGALTAQAATKTIPIVFGTGTDPVETGIVASLNRPGGNVTGVTNMSTELTAKRVGLIHELLPGAGNFAAIVNPKGSNADAVIREAQGAAATIGRPLRLFTPSSVAELDATFADLAQQHADALIINPDIFLSSRRAQILTLAAYHRLPAIYYDRMWAEAGGLMSYGASQNEMVRLVGIYMGRILKGEKPADLPVIRATKFEFVINLQTARIFRLQMPPTLLALADEVIE